MRLRKKNNEKSSRAMCMWGDNFKYVEIWKPNRKYYDFQSIFAFKVLSLFLLAWSELN